MAPQTASTLTPTSRARAVKERALELGFEATGVADLSPTAHAAELYRWLDSGMAGTMRYMHRQASHRAEPSRILRGATRAVVVTRNYYQADPAGTPGTGRVARYARGVDYHDALRRPLNELADFIQSLGPAETVTRAYVDAGPVPERELAQRAGLGWTGKNTMLIDPARGSFFFLGSVLTNLDIATDLPFEADRCGSCSRCLDACPTGAFAGPRVLDARKCISYLTIEHRGDIDPALGARMGDHVFGCDICQDVCPWNVSFAVAAADSSLEHDPRLARIDLTALSEITDREFQDQYAATALSRAGPEGLRRNARIVLNNSRRETRADDRD